MHVLGCHLQQGGISVRSATDNTPGAEVLDRHARRISALGGSCYQTERRGERWRRATTVRTRKGVPSAAIRSTEKVSWSNYSWAILRICSKQSIKPFLHS